MINWTNGIDNLHDKFQALPAEERATIINQIINVNGMKVWKTADKENYGKPKRSDLKRLQIHVFQVVASKHILNRAL
jgi:hypothetical protein